MKTCDLVIIGGGSAGMAAAIAARKKGIKDILILERGSETGGILLQCIHNGFGLHTFGEELSGPSYAERFSDQIRQLDIAVETDALVLHLTPDRTLTYISPSSGFVTLKARCIILAMGCRERPRGAIGIPGTRPAGIWTAGAAQRYVNLDGFLPGRRVFILGSGDIGLIMARRMTLEGAKVLGVAELMPYSNGLSRNLKQCLEDFQIPLYLSHTVTDIQGRHRVNAVTISQVDGEKRPIPGTEKTFEVDTLLLSVGLLPENTLSEEAGIELHPRTRGPAVDEYLQTTLPGVFACGNVLHVHDLVDFVTAEGQKAGEAAARFLTEGLPQGHSVPVLAGDGLSYVLPQRIHPGELPPALTLSFRVLSPEKGVSIAVEKDGKLVKTLPRRVMLPAEMERITLKREELDGLEESLRLRILPQSASPSPAI